MLGFHTMLSGDLILIAWGAVTITLIGTVANERAH